MDDTLTVDELYAVAADSTNWSAEWMATLAKHPNVDDALRDWAYRQIIVRDPAQMTAPPSQQTGRRRLLRGRGDRIARPRPVGPLVPDPLPSAEDPAPAAAPVEQDRAIAPMSTSSSVRELWVEEPSASRGWFGRKKPVGPQRILDQWATIKTIVVANTKGGAGKTPLLMMLASAFGTARGGHVGVLDNNPTGDMALRLQQHHDGGTIAELIADPAIASAGAGYPTLAPYLRYHSSGQFHAIVAREKSYFYGPDGQVLRTPPTISAEQFRRVHQVMAQHFNPLLLDTGNNDADPNFIAAMDICDVLLIPVLWTPSTCKDAQTLLETLSDTGYSRLVDGAIIVGTAVPGNDAMTKRQRQQAKRVFERWGFTVVELPYDAHVAKGGILRWDQLQKSTQHAVSELAELVAQHL